MTPGGMRPSTISSRSRKTLIRGASMAACGLSSKSTRLLISCGTVCRIPKPPTVPTAIQGAPEASRPTVAAMGRPGREYL